MHMREREKVCECVCMCVRARTRLCQGVSVPSEARGGHQISESELQVVVSCIPQCKYILKHHTINNKYIQFLPVS